MTTLALDEPVADRRGFLGCVIVAIFSRFNGIAKRFRFLVYARLFRKTYVHFCATLTRRTSNLTGTLAAI